MIEQIACTVLFQSLIVRDKVREYLEKDPAYRSDDDIGVLLEFMQHMPVGSTVTMVTGHGGISLLEVVLVVVVV